MKVVLELKEMNGQVGDVIQSVSLSWLNIHVMTKPQKSIYNLYKTNQAPKEVLRNVSGEAKAGQLLVIMGASGAGKTTLLNVLTARDMSKVSVKGVILLNGQVVKASKIASISSYIQQQDMFQPLITVREHLIFQSLLRMDPKMSKNERIDCVEQVMKKFNLTKCMNTRIGGKFTFKGISGGEKKRLAFASEVLTNPSPTSGLDSFMAQNLIECLKTMASEGRTIICTIHQPSSQVFALFDNILFMADGRVAFMGTTRM
ncbi:unnamed protein product [Oppiella nova]|uniref:ABC transporter domain-containing protein n=1 Tax=Oppiella nova TaxID=334625 RepID=A0A7R9QYR3_9ACAR|nr:unnamed protein product [Oppiella nova]CAG2180492.1 unnamed protein product [Oppiella nova]